MATSSRHMSACAMIALLASLPAPALAQEAEAQSASQEAPADQSDRATEGSEVYYPQDFASFSPRSALDMLRQVPGFSVDQPGGNNQNRGLGQASGNVLLNGERIVTKSDSITDQLARIAADNVIRIEMVEGATLNIPGLSGRVANVIATSTDGLQGQFEWRPQLAAEYADHGWLEGIVSLSGTTGGLSFSVAAEGRPFRAGNGGPNIFTFGDGSVEERFSETNSRGNDKRLSGSIRYETGGGTVFNVNSSYLHRRFVSFDDEIVIGPVGLSPLRDRFDQRNRGHDFELGGDVDFALGPGRFKLILLDSYQKLQFATQTVIDPANGADPTGSAFLQVRDSGERIGRGEYSWSMWGSDWQWSVEAAFNRLDQTGDLSILDANGVFVPIIFTGGTGGVREDRYESLLSYGTQLADNLSLQVIAGGEYSNIRQTGGNANERTFVRPKGSISLAWSPRDGLDISMRLDRRVGQLNFGDFLADVNLNNNNQSSANNELRPNQSWGLEIEATRDLAEWGNATLRVFRRRFEDFVTFVPTPTGGEARGNVDYAQVMGIELNGTLRLDPAGLEGARLDLSAALRDSEYPDPVEPGTLPVQFADPHNFEIDFRYDLPGSNWAFGTGFRDTGSNPYYRVAEFGENYTIDRNLTAFIEHKDVLGMTVQVRVSNLLESEAVLDRRVFDGPRGSSPLLFREQRTREIGRVVNLTVKGNF